MGISKSSFRIGMILMVATLLSACSSFKMPEPSEPLEVITVFSKVEPFHPPLPASVKSLSRDTVQPEILTQVTRAEIIDNDDPTQVYYKVNITDDPQMSYWGFTHQQWLSLGNYLKDNERYDRQIKDLIGYYRKQYDETANQLNEMVDEVNPSSEDGETISEDPPPD